MRESMLEGANMRPGGRGRRPQSAASRGEPVQHSRPAASCLLAFRLGGHRQRLDPATARDSMLVFSYQFFENAACG